MIKRDVGRELGDSAQYKHAISALFVCTRVARKSSLASALQIDLSNACNKADVLSKIKRADQGIVASAQPPHERSCALVQGAHRHT
jgi:hypothetical protein